MEQFQAVISLARLQMQWRVGGDYSGETKHKIVFHRKLCVFETLTWMVSMFLMKKRDLNYYEYSYCYLECINILTSRPGQLKQKGGLTRFLLRYPIEFVRSPIFRKTIYSYHNNVKSVLLNPRSLGSEKWDRYKGFKVTSVYYEGLKKTEFPPELYIARGYRDKGNSRKVAIDASPSWQEVSMHRNFPENQNRKSLRNSLGFLDLLLYEERFEEIRERQLHIYKKRMREHRYKSNIFLD